jgi:hypothetical protein
MGLPRPSLQGTATRRVRRASLATGSWCPRVATMQAHQTTEPLGVHTGGRVVREQLDVSASHRAWNQRYYPRLGLGELHAARFCTASDEQRHHLRASVEQSSEGFDERLDRCVLQEVPGLDGAPGGVIAGVRQGLTQRLVPRL